MVVITATTENTSNDDKTCADVVMKSEELSPSSPSLHDEEDEDDDDDDDGDDDEILMMNDSVADTVENVVKNASSIQRSRNATKVSSQTVSSPSVKSSSAAVSSRYFVPYRTVGIVSSGQTFDLMTHQNSHQSIVAIPIYNRFQLLQCDKLHPVLVSQTVTVESSSSSSSSLFANNNNNNISTTNTTTSATTSTDTSTTTISAPERSIQHIISDPSMSITIVSHGSSMSAPSMTTTTTKNADIDDTTTTITSSVAPTKMMMVSDVITLYHRTRPIQSILLGQNDYIICDVISLGRIQQQLQPTSNGALRTSSNMFGKKSLKENVMVFAVILVKSPKRQSLNNNNTDDDETTTIPTIGYDSDSDIDETTATSVPKNKSKLGASCMGQVVIVVATRTSMHIQRRIMLQQHEEDDTSISSLSQFIPSCAMHPSTYLNKIVIGGCINGQLAACLLNIRSGKVIHIFQCLPKTSTTLTTTDTLQSPTYKVTTIEQSPAVDTVAMGTNHGMVYLINLKHDELLFQLQHKGKSRNTLQRHMSNIKTNAGNHSNNVTITSISFRTDGSAMRCGMSPMAVGRSDGTITIWDLTPPDDPVHFGRTVLCEMKNVHVDGIAKLQYFPQEPLLLSSGTSSNTITMHIFDNPDHSGRILRQRKGHATPPKYIRYLHPGAGAGNGVLVNMSDGTDASACQILSSGGIDRTIRVFSTVRSVLDKEYSQGRGIEKRAKQIGLDSTAELLLPPLVAMSTCEARTRDWGDLVTIHQDHAFAYVWSTKRGAQSGPVLRQLRWNVSAMKKPPPIETHATSVTISACASFALIGTKGGVIYKYNIQSGIARGSYPRSATNDDDNERYKRKNEKTIGDVNRTTKAIEKTLKTNTRSANLDKKLIAAGQNAKQERYIANKLQKASHIGYAVTGLAVDILNTVLISVGMDAKLIVWNLMTQSPHQKCPYMLPQPATKLCHVRESDLAAIALQDYSVLLFDCSSLYIVRRFGAGIGTNAHNKHAARITDLCFSGDGRSLYTSSMDSTIRVWDVPTNKCVDWLAFKAAPTSLTISPTGQYLATTHVGKVGINLWSDKSFYETVHIDGEQLTQPAFMDEPVPSDGIVGTSNKKTASSKVASDDSQLNNDGGVVANAPVVSKQKGLITLSGLPVAHWKNLFHLELVKQRNKPREPPKKPPTAPFFLQWRGEQIPSSEPLLEASVPTEEQKDDEEWAAAWSDDDANDKSLEIEANELKRTNGGTVETNVAKRPKITHFRSHIATILSDCHDNDVTLGEVRYQALTEYIATLGPSAIDVALSSLCNGMHDLTEGLPLLLLAAEWLLEACQSRERFEAINSYLHRFLYIHSLTIAGIKSSFDKTTRERSNLTPEELADVNANEKNYELLLESVVQLKKAQQSATNDLRVKMDHTLCLLRHFSRMI